MMGGDQAGSPLSLNALDINRVPQEALADIGRLFTQVWDKEDVYTAQGRGYLQDDSSSFILKPSDSALCQD